MISYDSLHSSLLTWLDERPAMKRNNTKKAIAKLLAVEGKEFIDRSRMVDGRFYIDLFALYEIADIAIFAITFLQKLGKSPELIYKELDPSTSQLEMILNMGELSGGVRMWSKDGLPPRYVVDEVHQIAQYAFTLIRSFGLDPAEVCMEKVGHNIARYAASEFKERSGGYTRNRRKCKKYVKDRNVEASFYAPLHEDSTQPNYENDETAFIVCT